MKKIHYITIIFFISIACNSHVYYKHKAKFKNKYELQNSIEINLNNFDAYCCAVFKDNKDLIRSVASNQKLDSAVHLVDLRYMLINKKNNRFIWISNIPNFYNEVSGNKVPYYMDYFKINYNSVINLYGMNDFIYGIIDSNFLVMNFKNSEIDKSIEFTKNGDTIILSKVHYANKMRYNQRIVSLDSVIRKEELIFQKMNSFQLMFTDYSKSNPDDCKIDSLRIGYYFKKWRNIEKKKENYFRKRIILKIEDDSVFYSFVERGVRFSFIPPPY